jgi:spermidine synthase
VKGRAPFLFLGFLAGFFSLSAQSLLFREHLLAYSGNEIGIAVFLSAWMLWGAAGGLLGRLGPAAKQVAAFGRRCRPLVGRGGAVEAGLCWLLPAYPVALVGQLLLFWSMRRLAGVEAVEPLPLPALVAWTALLSAPVSLVTGFLFTRVAQARAAAVREGAWATSTCLYGVEALGGLGGGLLSTVAALAGMPVLWGMLCVVLTWLLGSAWFSFRSGSRRAAAVHMVLAVTAGVAWFGGAHGLLERQRVAAPPVPPGLDVVETEDTAYQHVLVAALGKSRLLFLNGELTATLPGESEAEEEAVLLLAQKPDARHILVLGGGAEPLVCQLLRSPGVRVTYVSHDSRLADITVRNLPEELEACLSSPAVEAVVDEPRRYLERAKSRFDLVAARFGDPRTAQAARFYTVGFFRLASEALAPGGLFSTSIDTAENVLSDAGLAYAASVHATLQTVFEEVVFTSGERMTLFAARESGVAAGHGEEVERRFEPLRSRFPEVQPGVLAARFEQGRISALTRAFAQGREGVVATDESPSVFLLHLMAEYRTARLYEAFHSLRSRLLPGLLLALGGLSVALMIGRRRRCSSPAGSQGDGAGRWAGWALIGLTGFSGMLGHIALLMGYQVRFGSLLAEFGLLNALYMLGLFAGTALAGRLREKWRSRGGFTAASLLALTLSILLVFLLVGGGFPPVSEPLLRGVFLAACFATGFSAAWVIVAGAMALESRGFSAAGVAASIQVADNSGAVAGALGGGLVLLPASGLAGCALLAASIPVVPLLAGLAGKTEDIGRCGLRPVPGLALRRLLVFSWLLLGAYGWLLPHLVPADESGPGRVATSVALAPSGGAASGESAGAGTVTLSSARVCPEMGGYGGPMDVVAVLDGTERVVAVRLDSHVETPEYVWDLDEWMVGMTGKEAPRLQYGRSDAADGVEALTGATVTARAVTDIVRTLGTHQRRLRLGAGAPTDSPELPRTTQREALPDDRSVFARAREALEPWSAWLLALVGVVGAALYVGGRWRQRLVFLGFCIAIVGIGLNRQLALDHLALVAGGALPPAANVAVWVLLGLVLIAPVAGAVYCGYLCPFGAVADLLSLVGLRWTVPVGLDRVLRLGKFLVAALLALALALGASRSILAFDPLAFAFRLEWDALAAAILALIVVASSVWHRPWCRYLCPLGACLSAGEGSALSKSPLPVRRSAHCHLGVQVGSDWDCIRCNRCVRNERPEPRLFAARWSPRLLCLVLAVLVVLGGLRVIRRTSPSARREGVRAAAVEPVLPVSPPALEAGVSAREELPPGAKPQVTPPDGPRLQRKDNDPYPEQRRIDRRKVDEMLRDGSLSDHEAEFYLPVP